MHHFIASKDFRKTTLNRLAKKGIFVIGWQAYQETYANGATGTAHAYCLDDNGTGKVRCFLEVLAIAEAG